MWLPEQNPRLRLIKIELPNLSLRTGERAFQHFFDHFMIYNSTHPQLAVLWWRLRSQFCRKPSWGNLKCIISEWIAARFYSQKMWETCHHPYKTNNHLGSSKESGRALHSDVVLKVKSRENKSSLPSASQANLLPWTYSSVPWINFSISESRRLGP